MRYERNIQLIQAWDNANVFTNSDSPCNPSIINYREELNGTYYIFQIIPAKLEKNKRESYYVLPSQKEKSVENALRNIFNRNVNPNGEINFDFNELKDELKKDTKIKFEDEKIIQTLKILSSIHADIHIKMKSRNINISSRIISSISYRSHKNSEVKTIFPFQPKEYRVVLNILRYQPLLEIDEIMI